MSSDTASTATELTSLETLEQTPHAEVFDQRDPRTVRLRLEADEHVPKHQHPGVNVVLYVIDGALALTLGEEVYDVSAGDVVRFDGEQDISPRACEESTALVVFAPKE